jgi:pyrroline-5-carboxylate reductase
MLEGPGSLCVVGCGTMGEAIVGGLRRTQWVDPAAIVVTTRRADAAAELSERLGVRATVDNVEACRAAKVVLLCLKPQRLPSLLEDPAMQAALRDTVVVSIAAGITLERLSRWLPGSLVARAMPNTPALIGEGMTVISRSPQVDDAAASIVRRIFESVGAVLELENKHMDAVTSLNGSGPAFAYVVLEAMADGGVMMGLPREAALTIAARVFRGAAAMVDETELHPAALKDQVTTPAGCTIAGLLTLEDGRIRSVIARAIQEAAKVAGGLGESD